MHCKNHFQGYFFKYIAVHMFWCWSVNKTGCIFLSMWYKSMEFFILKELEKKKESIKLIIHIASAYNIKNTLLTTFWKCVLLSGIVLRLSPSHWNPLPVNPGLHSHRKDPSVFIQMALSEHGPGNAAHSSTSVTKLFIKKIAARNTFWQCGRYDFFPNTPFCTHKWNYKISIWYMLQKYNF